MSKKKKNIIITICLILASIVFTILVQNVDVQAIGPKGSSVGFANINKTVLNFTGENMIWYDITDIIGKITLLIAVFYALMGLTQLIKKKSILKIDKEILALGFFYLLVIGMYVFFEKVIINYRPVLLDGQLEASFPSSHTLMTLCLCGSSILINKKLFNTKMIKSLNIILYIVMIITIIGRLVSGVHWFTDIIGGIIISMSLLSIYKTMLCYTEEK